MIKVEITALRDVEELGREWRELESVASASFYTTWTWVGAWLRSLPERERVHVARLRHGDSVIGLATISFATTKRLGVTVRQAYLNQYGDPDYDSLFIEFNGVLSRPEHESACLEALLDGLDWTAPVGRWDELHLAGIQNFSLVQRVGLAAGLHVETLKRPAHFVDLDMLRRKRKKYIESLGPNTRRRIRRAIEEYEKLIGPIKVRAADGSAQALEYLDGLIGLHQKYWISRGEPGAFANPHFLAFHRDLVRESAGAGAHLLRVDAGDRPVGFIYVLMAGGVAYYYQSGFDYGLIEKHNSPGYVCLAAATEHYLAQGAHTFEFLAGTEEYKTRLGHGERTLAWVVLQRPHVTLMLERGARKVLRKPWRAYRRWRPATGNGTAQRQ
jgi:CelD/BcsL family acetyltransferase involved in cellulose biosynthesis